MASDGSSTPLDYAAEQRAKLDAKVRELRAEGWDVVPRRERDLAWSQRDDARDEYEMLRDAVSDAFNSPDGGDSEVSLMIDAVERAAVFLATEVHCACDLGMTEDHVACGRCRALGRRGNRPMAR